MKKNLEIITTIISIMVVIGVIILCIFNRSISNSYDKPLLDSNGEPLITHDDEVYKIEEVAGTYRDMLYSNGYIKREYMLRKNGLYNTETTINFLQYNKQYLIDTYGGSKEWETKYKYLYNCIDQILLCIYQTLEINRYTGGNYDYATQNDLYNFKSNANKVINYYDYYMKVKNN